MRCYSGEETDWLIHPCLKASIPEVFSWLERWKLSSFEKCLKTTFEKPHGLSKNTNGKWEAQNHRKLLVRNNRFFVHHLQADQLRSTLSVLWRILQIGIYTSVTQSTLLQDLPLLLVTVLHLFVPAHKLFPLSFFALERAKRRTFVLHIIDMISNVFSFEQEKSITVLYFCGFR